MRDLQSLMEANAVRAAQMAEARKRNDALGMLAIQPGTKRAAPYKPDAHAYYARDLAQIGRVDDEELAAIAAYNRRNA